MNFVSRDQFNVDCGVVVVEKVMVEKIVEKVVVEKIVEKIIVVEKFRSVCGTMVCCGVATFCVVALYALIYR